LHKLILTPTGWDALRSEASENLKQGNALSLKATNVEARITFAETMHQEFGEYLDPHPKLRIFWVTIAPNAAITTLEGNHLKAIRSLKQTLFRLREFDYWGMIEPGYFPRGGFNGTGEKTVSWHVHLFIWVKSDTQAADLLGKIETINLQNADKLPSGILAAYCVEHRLDAILKRIWYACKTVLKQYSFGSVKNGKVKIQKVALRPGQTAELHNLLWDTNIDELSIGNGEGKVVLANAFKQMKIKLKIAENTRQMKLETLAGVV